MWVVADPLRLREKHTSVSNSIFRPIIPSIQLIKTELALFGETKIHREPQMSTKQSTLGLCKQLLVRSNGQIWFKAKKTVYEV